MGKVGSEELSDILDSTFTALLEQTRREGGDLVKWGGDAVLLLFRGEGPRGASGPGHRGHAHGRSTPWGGPGRQPAR